MYLKCNMGDQRFHHTIPRERTALADSLPFCIPHMGEFLCDSSYFTTRWGLDEGLLLYTLEGEGELTYAGKTHALLPGSAMVLDCRRHHDYRTKGEMWHFLWIHFAGKSAFDYESFLNADTPEPVYADAALVRGYYDRLAAFETREDLPWLLEMASLLQGLLTELIRQKHAPAQTPDEGIARSLQRIRTGYREKITLEELAALSRLSRYHFIRVFRDATGQTPHQYLLTTRLLQAKRLLLETDRSVEQIAGETGFSDGKHFAAAFKAAVGMPPGQFRQEKTGNSPEAAARIRML